MRPNDGKPRSERGMDNPSDDFNGSGPTFVEFATMFKLESRPRPTMFLNESPRQLECVNCGMLLSWVIYTLDPAHFDRTCSDCGARSRDYYKTRPHQEVNDAQERNNGGIPEADVSGPG